LFIVSFNEYNFEGETNGKNSIINDVVEEWKNIPGLPDHEVSSFGRLRNKKVDTYLIGSINPFDGCVVVCMLHKIKKLHCLVTDAFI